MNRIKKKSILKWSHDNIKLSFDYYPKKNIKLSAAEVEANFLIILICSIP